MTEKEKVVELLAQTLAPRLYKLFGVKPEEMGFPFGDTPEDVDIHIARMFDPVGHWTDQARGIAVSVVNILEAGRWKKLSVVDEAYGHLEQRQYHDAMLAVAKPCKSRAEGDMGIPILVKR